jgi:hypothetical protein
LKNEVGPMLTQVRFNLSIKIFIFNILEKVSAMFGMDNMISELMSNKLEETLAVIRQVME